MARIAFALGFVTLALGLSRTAESREAMAWKLGADDFVRYRSEVLERTDSKLDGYARWGEIDDVAGFHGYELDRARRRVERRVTHPQLLYAPFVFALPQRLSRGRRLRIDETRGGNWRLSPFRARGHVAVTAAPKETPDGAAVLEGEVTFSEAPSGEASRSHYQLLEGAVRWTARFDPKTGLMRTVEYDLSWKTERARTKAPKGVHELASGQRTYRARVRLTLDRVLAYRYPGFQADVDAAIEEGLRYLESQQQSNGSWRSGRQFGQTALALLALVDGGRPADHPAVVKGFDWLLSQRPWNVTQVRSRTYAIGVALMALERRRTPEVEIERRRRGVHTEFLPRRLTGIERAWMRRCVGFLVECARIAGRTADRPVTGLVTEERWRWGYPREHDGPPLTGTGAASSRYWRYWDNSNTQYAVLGLESAARCGVRVPARAWFGIANHFLDVQAPSGPPHELRIGYATLRRKDALRPTTGDSHRYAPQAARAHARGWRYHEACSPDPGRPPTDLSYGAMTTAGIASLAIARSRVLQVGSARHHRELLARIDQALLDGFASLDGMFTVWSNPRYEGWYTYYLYGLERAGMLTAVERIGRHDWYWEGAMQLLSRQSNYGHGELRYWSYDGGGLMTTAWAILFLKRGTPPVVTPR